MNTCNVERKKKGEKKRKRSIRSFDPPSPQNKNNEYNKCKTAIFLLSTHYP
jgi:hypothetical protein